MCSILRWRAPNQRRHQCVKKFKKIAILNTRYLAMLTGFRICFHHVSHNEVVFAFMMSHKWWVIINFFASYGSYESFHQNQFKNEAPSQAHLYDKDVTANRPVKVKKMNANKYFEQMQKQKQAEERERLEEQRFFQVILIFVQIYCQTGPSTKRERWNDRGEKARVESTTGRVGRWWD